MEIFEKYKTLAEKKRLTAAEKAEIEAKTQEYGIVLNKRCSNCYRDAALQIALANKPKTEQENGEYELCEGIDITIDSFKYGTLRVNKANCTPANARKWIAAGIPLRFFKRYPNESNEQD